MKHRRIAISKVAPNPFRHVERYPIRADKVQALRESIRKTGWWGNIVARESGGKVQIAYGHHRLEAVKKELGASAEIEVIVRDLDDEAMLQIMARENMEEWGSSAVVEQETIRAVVEAYADAKIKLPKPERGASGIRFAPSTLKSPTRVGDFPYTASTIAAFIGWGDSKTQNILAALEEIERGLLAEKDFEGLGSVEARTLTRTARAAERAVRQATGDERSAKREGRATARRVARRMRSGEVSTSAAVSEARREVQKKYPKIPTLDAESLASKTATLINRAIRSDERLIEARKLLSKHLDQINKVTRRDLATECRKAAEWLWGFADDLGVPVEAAGGTKQLKGGS